MPFELTCPPCNRYIEAMQASARLDVSGILKDKIEKSKEVEIEVSDPGAINALAILTLTLWRTNPLN